MKGLQMIKTFATGTERGRIMKAIRHGICTIMIAASAVCADYSFMRTHLARKARKTLA